MKKNPTPKGIQSADQHAVPHDELGLERLVFFSDAVFAIAITLLALELRLPNLPETISDVQLLAALLAIWPKYLSYLISFLVIGIYWMAHHRTFNRVVRYDQRLVWLNLLLLMSIAFIPFPTALLGEYGNRTSTIFYAATMTVVGLLQASVQLYSKSKDRFLAQPLDARMRRLSLLRAFTAPAIFLLSILLAFWDSDIAKYSWILIAVTAFLH